MLGIADQSLDIAENTVNDYMVGEVVKVISGPFNDFTGRIEEVNAERMKLKVMVKVFGRDTAIELDNSQVERS